MVGNLRIPDFFFLDRQLVLVEVIFAECVAELFDGPALVKQKSAFCFSPQLQVDLAVLVDGIRPLCVAISAQVDREAVKLGFVPQSCAEYVVDVGRRSPA